MNREDVDQLEMVRHTSDMGGIPLVYGIELGKLRADTDWGELGAVLRGERMPRPMAHVTRIVGYYSVANRNWNRSKVGELKDRQAGDYGV